MKPDSLELADSVDPSNWVMGFLGPGKEGKYTDCWELVCYIYKRDFNIELPPFVGIDWRDTRSISAAFIQEEMGPNWTHLETPKPFCIVAMSTKRAYHHAGLWLPWDGGSVLHFYDHREIVADSLASLRNKQFRIIRFYKYNGHHPNY